MIAAEHISARSETRTHIKIQCIPPKTLGKDVTAEIKALSEALVRRKDVKDKLGISELSVVQVQVTENCHLATVDAMRSSPVEFTLIADVGHCHPGCSGMFTVGPPAVAYLEASKYNIE